MHWRIRGKSRDIAEMYPSGVHTFYFKYVTYIEVTDSEPYNF